MPGIVVATGPRASDALAAMAHDGWLATTFATRPASESFIAGAAAYAGYPLTQAHAAGCVAVLEGAIYGEKPAAVRSALEGFARSFAADAGAARDEAERWAARIDGDFVLLLVAGDAARALVVNDRLGRLPLFASSDGAGTAIAREIKCVRAACGAGEVDRHALAQMLLFSFPLGEKTLHARIARVPAASSALIAAGAAIDVRQYYKWDFQALADAGGAPEAGELAERFTERCAAQAAWAGSRRIVLGLSGGLDSRSVAAALSRASVPYAAVTFTSRRKKAAEETQTSMEIARALGVPWEELQLTPPSWEDERRMAEMRDGTSNVALAFIAEYFALLAARFGADALHFTGDGGDRALPDLRAEVPIKDRDAFVDYRFANGLWSVEDAAALVGLPARDVVDAICEHFGAYPEHDPAYFNVRFMIADWAPSRLFFGEDRNRSFLWNATPFYCQSFFEAAMRAPLKRKAHYKLYAAVLRALDGRLRGIAKSNWGYAVDSPMVRIAAWRESASALLARTARRFGSRSGTTGARYGTQANDPGFAALARSYAGDGFDRARLAEASSRGLDKLQYHMLATALLYMDGVWGPRADGKEASR